MPGTFNAGERPCVSARPSPRAPAWTWNMKTTFCFTEEFVSSPQCPSEGRLLSSFGSFVPLFQNVAVGHGSGYGPPRWHRRGHCSPRVCRQTPGPPLATAGQHQSLLKCPGHERARARWPREGRRGDVHLVHLEGARVSQVILPMCYVGHIPDIDRLQEFFLGRGLQGYETDIHS